MEVPRKFLHDRMVLLLVTAVSMITVIGVSTVFLRFDVSKNPTTVVAYRPNISGSSIIAGKPIDIYVLGIFMLMTSIGALVLSARIYPLRRYIALFVLMGSV